MKAKDIEIFRPACHVDSTIVSARVLLDGDATELMPYLNATREGAQYFPKGPFVRFRWKDVHPVTIEPDKIAVGGFPDADSARAAAGEVLEMLNELAEDKDKIEPDFTAYNPPAAMDLFKLLPKKGGCGVCGFPTCMAFAVALSKGDASLDDCSEVCSDPKWAESLAGLREVMGQ